MFCFHGCSYTFHPHFPWTSCFLLPPGIHSKINFGSLSSCILLTWSYRWSLFLQENNCCLLREPHKTHTHTHKHTHAHAHTHARTHPPTHQRTHAHTHTRTHTHAHSRTRTHARTHHTHTRRQFEGFIDVKHDGTQNIGWALKD
jgi:hypothetical protein